MNSLRSAVALRTILCDSASELATINSTTLPNGATAYQNASSTLWRLNKAAGDTFDDLIGSGLVLRPDDQTDARWIAEQQLGSSPYYLAVHLVASAVAEMTGSAWRYLGNVDAFERSQGNADVFELDTENSEVTYHGPPRFALVTCTITMANDVGATAINVQACISRNSDVVVGSTTDHAADGEVAATFANVATLVTVQRMMLLNPGTTLRLALRNVTNADDLRVSFYQMVVTPL